MGDQILTLLALRSDDLPEAEEFVNRKNCILYNLRGRAVAYRGRAEPASLAVVWAI